MVRTQAAFAVLRRLTAVSAIGLGLTAMSAHAQSSPQPPALPSPAINYITTVNGNQVTFRLYAPNASNVTVSYGKCRTGNHAAGHDDDEGQHRHLECHGQPCAEHV